MADVGVRFELVDDVAILRLTDPAKRNALSLPMLESLIAAVDRAIAEARAILITGDGEAFCAGGNLSSNGTQSVPRAQRDWGAIAESHFIPLLLRLRDMSLPLVVAVNGAAAGGGFGLALAGDYIVAAENAFFLAPFSRIGLGADAGLSYTLVQSIGRVRASEVMMLAERIPAAKALEWGMINAVTPSEALLPAALDVARRLARGPASLSLIRQAVWAGLENSYADQLMLERQMQLRCGRSPDCDEGIAAFIERREPRFSGVLED